jgi:hypothetical protein
MEGKNLLKSYRAVKREEKKCEKNGEPLGLSYVGRVQILINYCEQYIKATENTIFYEHDEKTDVKREVSSKLVHDSIRIMMASLSEKAQQVERNLQKRERQLKPEPQTERTK